MSAVARKNHYRVTGRFDVGGGMQLASVEIDRGAGTIAVRPLRRRRTYVLPLATVAAWICRTILHAEVRESREAKRKKKRKP